MTSGAVSATRMLSAAPYVRKFLEVWVSFVPVVDTAAMEITSRSGFRHHLIVQLAVAVAVRIILLQSFLGKQE